MISFLSASLAFSAPTSITKYTPHFIEAEIANADQGVTTFLIASDDASDIQLSRQRGTESRTLRQSEYEVSRTLHIGPVAFRKIQLDGGGNSTIQTGDRILVEWNSAPHSARPIPRALLPVIRSTVDNWESVQNQYTVADYPGDYLIITDDVYQPYLTDYVQWKTQQGYHVTVKSISETGTSATEIREAIRTEYSASHGQLAYVLLVGDADNSHPENINSVPAFYYASPTTGDQNVTDHPYSLMDDDYFSDLFVGRFSIDGILELMTMINRITKYEKAPPDGHWPEHALLIAGNYSNTPPNPITPIWTTRWLRKKLIDNGYTQVDTIFYPPTQLGQQAIADFINDGVGIVNYRGWADANGWQYPQFKINDMINLLNNAPYSPIITSIVCNTGDFANTVDPVFGEQWMRLGTPANPKGAAGFFGPSDLHTSTKYNNSICAGFYEGLLVEGIHDLGAAAYRGKMQLYRGFPLERGDEQWVEFYFHVYNILGDPSTEIRTKRPLEPNVDLPDEFAEGATTITLQLDNSDIDDYTSVYVTFLSDDDTTGAYFDNTGSATLTFQPLHSDATVTISGPNILPQIETIPVAGLSIYATISNLQIDGTPKPGQTVTLTPIVENTGQMDLANVTLELQPSDGITILGSGTFTANTLPSGSEFTPDDGIDINIAPDYMHVSPQQFLWRVMYSGAIWIAGSDLEIPNTLFDMTNLLSGSNQNYLTGGETTSLQFNLRNISRYDSQDGTVTVASPDQDVTVSGSGISFNEIQADSTGESLNGLEVTVPGNRMRGSSVTMVFSIEEADGRQFEVRKVMAVGPVNSDDPVGPDEYGYFAYDNSDTRYSAAPVNETWRARGTGAVLHSLRDDENRQLSLPWDFQYYGQTFDEITLSSNGWVSFLPENIPYFRNWGIPNPIGPRGLIAGYWDDLDAPNGEDMEIYTENQEDEFVITWDKSYANYDESTPEKFQIVLRKTTADPTPTGDDEILILYNSVEDVDQNNNYSTVGIEAPDKQSGLQYVYAAQYSPGAAHLQSGRVILFTTRQSDRAVAISDEPGVPQRFSVGQNYPNPFNPSTTFAVNIPRKGNLVVNLYNVRGEKVWQQSVDHASPGVYSIRWNGETVYGNAPSGIYLAQIRYESGGEQWNKTFKMTLLR